MNTQTPDSPKLFTYLATGAATLVTTGIISLLGSVYLSFQTVAKMDVQQQVLQRQLEKLIEEQAEIRKEVYTESDANKDFRVRDLYISQLQARVEKLEK